MSGSSESAAEEWPGGSKPAAATPVRSSSRQDAGAVTPEADFLAWLKTRQDQWQALRSSESNTRARAEQAQRLLEEAKVAALQRQVLGADAPPVLTPAQILTLQPLLKENAALREAVLAKAQSWRQPPANGSVAARSLSGNDAPRIGGLAIRSGGFGASGERRAPLQSSFRLPHPAGGPNEKTTKFYFKNKPFMGWIKQFTLIEEGPNQGRLAVSYVNPNSKPPMVVSSSTEAAALLSRMALSRELEMLFDFSPVFCICHEPEDSRRYVECAVGKGGCGGWMHMECVGLKPDLPEHVLEPMVCPLCTNFAIATSHQDWLSGKKILPATISRARIYGDFEHTASPVAGLDLPYKPAPQTTAAAGANVQRSEDDSKASASSNGGVSRTDTSTPTDSAEKSDFSSSSSSSSHGDADDGGDDDEEDGDDAAAAAEEPVRYVAIRSAFDAELAHSHAAHESADRISTSHGAAAPRVQPVKASGFAVSSTLSSHLRRSEGNASAGFAPTHSQAPTQSHAPSQAQAQTVTALPPNPTQPIESIEIDGLEIQSSYLPHFQYGIERSEEAWPQFADVQRCQTAMYSWAQACKAVYSRTCERAIKESEARVETAIEQKVPRPKQPAPARTTAAPSPRPVPKPREAAAAQSTYVSPYANFLVPALTPEEEEAASQLLGTSADATLPDGRTCKVFVQGGWMFSAAARRNMVLAEARRQSSKNAQGLFNKHKAELFKIAVRCAGSNRDRKKGAKWVGPAFANMPAEDGGLRTLCVGHSREVKSLKDYCGQQNRCTVCLAPLSRTAGSAVAKQSKRRLDFANGRNVEEVLVDGNGRFVAENHEGGHSRKRSKRENGASDREHVLVHAKCKQQLLKMLAEFNDADSEASSSDDDRSSRAAKRSLEELSAASDQAKHCSLCSLQDGLLMPFHRRDARVEWAHPMCIMWFKSNVEQGSHGHSARESAAGSSRQFQPASEADGCATPTHVDEFGRCAMCGEQDGESIRCAVYGCYVRVHPLCGLVENCYSGVAQPKRPDAQGRMVSVPFLLCPYHSTAVQTG